MTFGTKLKKLREEKNISQKEIASILEVSQTIYGKWESDVFYPTYKNLQKLASFYMVDVDSLTKSDDSVNIINSSNFINNSPNSKLNSLKAITELSKSIEKLVLLVHKQTELLEKQLKNEK
jgi:transcriptional regulator with XRE-family HTH domain